MEHPVRILIMDRRSLRRRGLVSLITETPGLHLAGEARDEASLRMALAEFRPDVLVVDHHLVDRRALEEVRERQPRLRIVSINADTDGRDLPPHLDGALPVDAPQDETVEVLTGYRPVNGHGDPQRDLSPRELLLLRCLGSCMTLQEAALHMHVRPTTASTYRRRLLDKLGLPSTAHLIRFAVKHGLEA